MTQFGWILVSLGAHAALVLAGVRAFAEPDAPRYVDRAEAWQGVDVDLTAPFGEKAEAQTEPAPEAEGAAAESETGDVREQREPARETVPQPKPAAVPAEQAPEPDAPASERPELPAAPEAAEPPAPDGDDWLSVDDQLPLSEPEAAGTSAQQPEKDQLVERLMAAERQKQSRGRQTTASTATERPEPAASEPPRSVEVVGQRNLATAFTRAITQAEMRNPAWQTHALGTLGRVRVEIRLQDGEVVDTEIRDRAPKLLRKMVDKTLRLIRRGRFALPYSDADAGTQVFEVEVRLSQVPYAGERIEYGFDRPTDDRPGRAYFTLPGGRHFEALVDPHVGGRSR